MQSARLSAPATARLGPQRPRPASKRMAASTSKDMEVLIRRRPPEGVDSHPCGPFDFKVRRMPGPVPLLVITFSVIITYNSILYHIPYPNIVFIYHGLPHVSVLDSSSNPFCLLHLVLL